MARKRQQILDQYRNKAIHHKKGHSKKKKQVNMVFLSGVYIKEADLKRGKEC